jgi:hypothetical protein
MHEERLRKLATSGDHLAEYYLGKYYLEEKGSVDQGLYWLLKSCYGDPRYSTLLLNQLIHKYPTEIKKIKKGITKEN